MPLNKELIANIEHNMPNPVSKNTTNNTKRSHSPVGMRKRHWFLSSAIIVGCSWITHTTTANIDPEPTAQQAIGLTNIVIRSPSSDIPAQKNVSGSQNADLLAITNNSQASIEIDKKVISAAPELRIEPHIIARGESLGIIFRKAGLDLAIPHYISKHPVAKQLTSIRVGKTIEFKFDDDDVLKEISYPLSALKRLDVSLDDISVSKAEVVDVAFDTKQRSVSAEISSSLYLAAQDAGLSNNLIMEMVRIFGWDIDFVQDIRVGDSFHIVFDEYFKAGEKLDDGNILAAEFTTQGHTYRAIRFEDDEGFPSYFNAEGQSMLGTFLRSPVEFSRISSRFGKRLHPISKKWKAHKGVDYAASRGTPIRATADGKITLAGRKGGYGKTVVIRHAGRFSTLYAHMNGYAKGIKSGIRVKQGQTIGYVGSTGMSTGPHLHYEFRVDGVHRNSLTYKTPKASAVSKANISKFNALSENFGRTLDTVKKDYELAKASRAKQSKKT